MTPTEGWLQAALRGDKAELERLYREHGTAAWRLAMRILGDEDRALDVLHDVFATLPGRLKGFREGAALQPWLSRVVSNQCFQLRRSERARRETALPDEPLRSPEPFDDERSDSVDRVRQALAELNEAQRDILVLVVLENHSYADVAALLEITEDAVRGRVFRARIEFRRAYMKLSKGR